MRPRPPGGGLGLLSRKRRVGRYEDTDAITLRRRTQSASPVVEAFGVNERSEIINNASAGSGRDDLARERFEAASILDSSVPMPLWIVVADQPLTRDSHSADALDGRFDLVVSSASRS